MEQPPKKILFPLGYSARNIGDGAIFIGTEKLLKQLLPNSQILFHTGEPEFHDVKQFASFKPHLYYWAVFENQNLFVRVERLARIFCYMILLAIGYQFNFSKRSGQLKNILADYQNADLIILSGGGYLRSKPGIKQALNLLMILQMIKILL